MCSFLKVHSIRTQNKSSIYPTIKVFTEESYVTSVYSELGVFSLTTASYRETLSSSDFHLLWVGWFVCFLASAAV